MTTDVMCGKTSALVVMSFLLIGSGTLAAQNSPSDCQPYTLRGTVLECTATGSPLSQLRTATFIAGSEAVGETIATAIRLEVATAPLGSSSGGFTISFDSPTRIFVRRSPTFGPAFSERALTIGRNRISGGFSVLHRSYDKIDTLSLSGFDAFRFQGGTLPVALSTVEVETETNAVAAFGGYGVLDNFDISVLVPYESISIHGFSRIYGPSNDELQSVTVRASATGLGDIALFGKYRFLTSYEDPGPQNRNARNITGGLALGLTVRVPSGSTDNLLGLGITRTLVSAIGSTTWGHFSPHVNLGYEAWSKGVAIPKDFQGLATISAKDQVQYSGGFEVELHPQFTVLVDVVGRYLRGAGRVGYQPFVFPPNFANVSGANALVAQPGGANTLLLAPGAKWNVFGSALLTANALVQLSDNGLRARFTPVIGLDWGFRTSDTPQQRR